MTNEPFSWAMPIQRYYLSYLAKQFNLPDDFSLPEHSNALRTTLRRLGLCYHLNLDQYGWVTARLYQSETLIGRAMLDAGDEEDFHTIECRTLALALLNAYERGTLIIDGVDLYPMGQSPLQMLLAEPDLLATFSDSIAATFVEDDRNPFQFFDPEVRHGLHAIAYMLGIRQDFSVACFLDPLWNAFAGLELTWGVEFANDQAVVFILYSDLDEDEYMAKFSEQRELAGFSAYPFDRREDEDEQELEKDVSMAQALTLATLMAARNGHIWRPSSNIWPSRPVNWSEAIEPPGLSHSVLQKLFERNDYLELDAHQVAAVRDSLDLLLEHFFISFAPEIGLDADGKPAFPALRALVDDYESEERAFSHTLEQLMITAMDQRMARITSREDIETYGNEIRRQILEDRESQVHSLFAQVEDETLVDPVSILSQSEDEIEKAQTCETYLQACKQNYLVTSFQQTKANQNLQRAWLRWCAGQGNSCVLLRVEDEQAELRVKLPPTWRDAAAKQRVSDAFFSMRSGQAVLSQILEDEYEAPKRQYLFSEPMLGHSTFTESQRAGLEAAFGALDAGQFEIGVRDACITGIAPAQAKELANRVMSVLKMG